MAALKMKIPTILLSLSGPGERDVCGMKGYAFMLHREGILMFCPWNEDTYSHAAMNGHLDVLKWTRGNGSPSNAYTCSHTAIHGLLDVLKWVKANRCI